MMMANPPFSNWSVGGTYLPLFPVSPPRVHTSLGPLCAIIQICTSDQSQICYIMFHQLVWLSVTFSPVISRSKSVYLVECHLHPSVSTGNEKGSDKGIHGKMIYRVMVVSI